MSAYNELPTEHLKEKYLKLKDTYNNFKKRKLCLDMSRGKPCKEQLDISSGMLENLDLDYIKKTRQNIDARNYGLLSGTIEARKFFSNILKVDPENIIVGGGSSLSLMYNYIAMAMQFAVAGNAPWNNMPKVKFLCPCPGYDRHFSICELFNIDMINIDMDQNGPDMEKVKALTEKDPEVKGIWCVPKYSNPTGITYSDETVKKFACLKPAAKDFKILWDNAYIIHDLGEKKDNLLNIFDECRKHNNMDMVIEFTSTSKITFPGAGLSAIAASKKNIDHILKILSKQTICFDKINQIRHCLFLPSYEKLQDHMKKHSDIIKPKFDLVINEFEKNLKNLKGCSWSDPNGGYFISFNAPKGCAKKIYDLCKNAGLKLTSPGATYPYGIDINDSNIRIAPTYPSIEELKLALELFCVCVKLSLIEKSILKNSSWL